MRRCPATLGSLAASAPLTALLAALAPLVGTPALAREEVEKNTEDKVETKEKIDEKVERKKAADATLRSGSLRSTSEWDRFMEVVRGFSDLVGRVSARKLTYKTFPPSTDVRGQVRITKACWRFETITGDMCGGDVSAEAAIDFLKDRRRFRLRANVENARLGDLTRFYDYAAMRGFISGKFELSATSVKGSLHGSAEFHVSGADLGRLPIALKVVSFIFLDFPGHQKEVVSEADGHLTITPRGLVFQDLSLRSKGGAFSLEAERNGRINYKGEIDVYFRPVFEEGLTKVVPGLPEIIDAIRGRGGRVRVTGTIREPKFKWGAFR